jgi:RNA 2',3'-cyclic 3'-phosphodiesterase
MRLFFAAWPQVEAAARLAHWARELAGGTGGRATRAETIHLTLAFLGDVAVTRGADAVAAARRVEAPAHAFAIEQARYWAHNRIVWVGPREAPVSLGALVEGLRGELEASGFALERRAFAAHVTVIRKASAPTAPLEPPAVQWPVREFVLVRSILSREGARYEVLERFALR